MSKENLNQFIQKVIDSEGLQARIGDEIGVDSLIALGAEHGCEFNAEDVQAVWGASDDDLDGVAGGYTYELKNVQFSGNTRLEMTVDGKFRKPALDSSIIDSSRTSYSGGTDGDDI